MKAEILNNFPNVFRFNDGHTVKTIADWEERRKEILKDTISLEFDEIPPKPESIRFEKLSSNTYYEHRLDTYNIYCANNGKEISFMLEIYRPNDDAAPCPVLITGDSFYPSCSDKVIENANNRGFVVVKFNRTQLAPDFKDRKNDGIYPLFPTLNFTAISAWAWGYQRVVDVLEKLPFINKEYIAVAGHSRGGKTVLLAGAIDERIKYVNPNGSGTHGCGCYRYNQVEYGENGEKFISEPLSHLFEHFPYWMGQEMKKYVGRENEIPHDSHFLKALIAPRILFETNAYDDIWANPKGSYLTNLAAKEVWKLYQKEDNCLTRYRNGTHAHTYEEYIAFLDVIETDIKGIAQKEEFKKAPYEDNEF